MAVQSAGERYLKSRRTSTVALAASVCSQWPTVS
jgi:hypothetical protein